MVDRFTKFAHFIPLTHLYFASIATSLFMKHIFKLDSMPKSIILDSDKTFTSKFWEKIFKHQEF